MLSEAFRERPRTAMPTRGAAVRVAAMAGLVVALLAGVALVLAPAQPPRARVFEKLAGVDAADLAFDASDKVG
jgi:hypothetical protein